MPAAQELTFAEQTYPPVLQARDSSKHSFAGTALYMYTHIWASRPNLKGTNLLDPGNRGQRHTMTTWLPHTTNSISQHPKTPLSKKKKMTNPTCGNTAADTAADKSNAVTARIHDT